MEVNYKGVNLRKSGEKLVILNILLINKGSKDVNETDYYSLTPFGIIFDQGKIAVHPEIIDASHNYLKDERIIQFVDSTKIYLNKIPLEVNSYIKLKLVSIVDSNLDIEISPVGYITGNKNEIQIVESYKENISSFNFTSTIKSVFMTIGGITVFMIFVIIINNYQDKHRWRPPYDEEYRKSKIRKIRKYDDFSKDEIFSLLIDKFIQGNNMFAYYLIKVLNSTILLDQYLSYIDEKYDPKGLKNDEDKYYQDIKQFLINLRNNGKLGRKKDGSIKLNKNILEKIKALYEDFDHIERSFGY